MSFDKAGHALRVAGHKLRPKPQDLTSSYPPTPIATLLVALDQTCLISENLEASGLFMASVAQVITIGDLLAGFGGPSE